MANNVFFTREDAEKKIKKNKTIKRSSLLTITLMVVGVVVVGRLAFWWFTPALTQRDTLQTFFSDLYTGNDASAYKLTSIAYQINVPYKNFLQTANLFKNKPLNYSYKSYITLNRRTAIIGTISNSKIQNKEIAFGINVATDPISGKNSIDTFDFFLVNTAKK